MDRLIITNTPINSGLGDTISVAFDKVNDNFEYLFNNSVIENISQLNNDIGFITASSIPTTYDIVNIIGLTASIENLQNQIDQSDFITQDVLSYELSITENSINIINSSISTINSTINQQNILISNIQSQIGTSATIGTASPSSSSDVGEVGEIRITNNYIYFCINTNTWVRASVGSW